MSGSLTTNRDAKAIRTTKFPPEFNVKVDMKKVNIHLIKSWAQTEIARILNDDDDVVSELVSNILEGSRYPNIKELQIQLTGFLDKDAAAFCENLWKLCISAQQNAQGIPKELIEAKKAELTQEKAEKEKAREEAAQREEAERERDREMARIRERERRDRERGRGGRGGRTFDRKDRRDSRSPPPRYRRNDDNFHRDRPRVDTYIPSNGARRRRSPSRDRSPSRSRSPPRQRRRRNSSSTRSGRSPSSPARRRNSSSNSDPASPGKKHNTKNGRRRGDDRRSKSRSPARRRRSRSPKRHRRRSPSRSASPPAKRSRKASPPRRRRNSSSSRSARSSPSPERHRDRGGLAPNDLMAANSRKNRSDNLRLSRDPSSDGMQRSQTPEAGANGGQTPAGNESDARSETMAAA